MKIKKSIATIVLILTLLSLSCGGQQSKLYFKGALATVQPLATDIGADVLNRGGNAVDCAVAVGFALAVVYPEAGNIGGGGFAMLYLKDSSIVTSLDFREKAPIFATADMYLDSSGNVIENASLLGYKAAGVPGTVAGLLELYRRYGTLPLDDLINPAIDLAEDGFEVYPILAKDLEEHKDELAKFESTKKIFFKDEHPLKVGDKLVQKDLAETLKRIRQFGRKGFYGGRTADLIETACLNNGGLITLTDLDEYMPKWRKPIDFTFRDLKIYSMGPPSSGGILLAEIFNMMEDFELPWDSPSNPVFVHMFVEACRRAYADRATYLGDIDFTQIPVKKLISKQYAGQRISNFDPGKATPIDSIYLQDVYPESESTTHFSIVDQYGNAVGITYTINASFGAKVVIDSLGFFLNDEMDDFVIKPGVPNLYGLVGGDANKIEPQKRPLSSMSPTLVFRDNNLMMITGSPGGSKIITTVALSIFKYFYFDLSLKQTVNQPKYHDQLIPEILYHEVGAFEKGEAARLQEMEYVLKEIPDYGNLNIVAREDADHKWEAESDRRRQGTAAAIY
jgi:gamma-glutamyltranspeptidase/glutathione hydrolase